MTNQTTIERNVNTYSPAYAKCRKDILKWRADNKEWIRDYNRNYQAKLRKDPVKYAELRARCDLRAYLLGKWKKSYSTISRLGMTVEQLAEREGMTLPEFRAHVKSTECDHIIPASFFNDSKYAHLKPYCYRHYNLQFLPRGINRTKHNWIDTEDPRIKLVLAFMEMDWLNCTGAFDREAMRRVEEASKMIIKLSKAVKSIK